LLWTARVRHRSSTSFMIGGPDMGNMGGADKPGDKPKCKKGLGGLLGGALGAC
jgi:hypothetical protein